MMIANKFDLNIAAAVVGEEQKVKKIRSEKYNCNILICH